MELNFSPRKSNWTLRNMPPNSKGFILVGPRIFGVYFIQTIVNTIFLFKDLEVYSEDELIFEGEIDFAIFVERNEFDEYEFDFSNINYRNLQVLPRTYKNRIKKDFFQFKITPDDELDVNSMPSVIFENMSNDKLGFELTLAIKNQNYERAHLIQNEINKRNKKAS